MQDSLLPLFPLNLVLLPKAAVPLHIFEERYKEMIGEALENQSEFGIVLAGEKGVVNTGCSATVDRVVNRYPDGRLDIIIRGQRRFELLELNDEKPYLRGTVEFFDDIEPEDPAPPQVLARAIRAYEDWQEFDKTRLERETPDVAPELNDRLLSFQLARTIPDVTFRQVLLSTRSETERLKQVADFLPGFVAKQRLVAHIKEVAPKNGHGKRKVDEFLMEARQYLLIDADDTLWENNIYFEDAFDEFVEFLAHSRLTPAEIRDVLNEIESANAKIHGYGSMNFGRNLQKCYEHLAERHIGEADLARIMGFAERILSKPIELIEGVEETLGYLSDRHELTLFTKGHPEEQRLKVERSGLARYFSHTAIAKEKDVATYRSLIVEREIDPAVGWMIGNSPKSDVNPALEAGLGAVFVPHARTWVLERTELRRDFPRLVEVERFEDLRRVF